MEITEQDVDSLNQLDRIEFRQKESLIKVEKDIHRLDEFFVSGSILCLLIFIFFSRFYALVSFAALVILYVGDLARLWIEDSRIENELDELEEEYFGIKTRKKKVYKE